MNLVSISLSDKNLNAKLNIKNITKNIDIYNL